MEAEQPPNVALRVKGLLPINIDCVVVELAAKFIPGLAPHDKVYCVAELFVDGG